MSPQLPFFLAFAIVAAIASVPVAFLVSAYFHGALEAGQVGFIIGCLFTLVFPWRRLRRVLLKAEGR